MKLPWFSSQLNINATCRLTLQYFLTKSAFSHLLNPSIPMPKGNMVVADIATGTGVWALELAELVPSGVAIEGVDINLEEVPPSSWLPPNVVFRQFDVLSEISDEFLERYDLIQLEYLILFVSDDNFDAVLGRVLKMLSEHNVLFFSLLGRAHKAEFSILCT